MPDVNESPTGGRFSRLRYFAPALLQLHLSYLTEASLQLLNGKVPQNYSSEVFHNQKNFVLVCPSVPSFAATPLESFSGIEAALKT